MSNLFFLPRAEVQTSSGAVGAGYKLYFYQTGTSTALDTYADDTFTTANANPVVADSAGRFGAIFLQDRDYKVVLTDADGTQIWSADPVHGANASNLTDDTIGSTLDTGGSSNAYTLTVNRTMTALANGDMFVAKASFQNTGAATLTITEAGGTAFSAKTIKKFNDKDLASGDIENGQWCVFKYDGTYMQLLSPVATQGDTPGRNTLINGDFRIAQRGTSFTSATTPANSDDTVLLDRWVLLSDGNDVVDVSQETSTVPTGSYGAIKLDVETGNKKFGILQVLEAKDAAELIGGTASLSFKARRTGTSIDHLRAGIISWSSTADSVTSDVVSAWASAGTNPTLATNWTFENTPASLATLTTAYQTFTIEGVSIDTASTANVAVFIWVDDTTTTVGDFLYITEVKLEPGPVATTYRPRAISDELLLCQRYYCKTFPQGTAPVQNVGDQVGAIHAVVQVAGTAGRCSAFWKFPVTMRATPSITYYSPGAASADWWNIIATAQASGTAASLGAGDNGVTIINPQVANDAVQDDVAVHASADAEL